MNKQQSTLEDLCIACNDINIDQVNKILKDPLSKTIINQPWSSDDKSAAAPPLIVTLISGLESNDKDTIKIIKALVRNGADVNITISLPDPILKSNASMSPLMIVMWYTKVDIEIVKFLVQNGADMNFKNEFGMNPLYWAVCNPNGTERAKYLISAGADIDIMILEEKIKNSSSVSPLVIGGVATTPLQLASKEGKIEIVKELLLHGANTKIKNGDGNDSLHFAKQNSHDEIIKLLEEASTPLWDIQDVISSEDEKENKESDKQLSEEKENNVQSREISVDIKEINEMKETMNQFKNQIQSKDQIILSLRQQIKQLNRTIQERDQEIQKHNDTVALVYHILKDNLTEEKHQEKN